MELLVMNEKLVAFLDKNNIEFNIVLLNINEYAKRHLRKLKKYKISMETPKEFIIFLKNNNPDLDINQLNYLEYANLKYLLSENNKNELINSYYENTDMDSFKKIDKAVVEL